jgi:hypothetical protein
MFCLLRAEYLALLQARGRAAAGAAAEEEVTAAAAAKAEAM